MRQTHYTVATSNFGIFGSKLSTCNDSNYTVIIIPGILIPEQVCSATKEWCWLRGSDPDVDPWIFYYEKCEKNSDCKKLMDAEADCEGVCAAF